MGIVVIARGYGEWFIITWGIYSVSFVTTFSTVVHNVGVLLSVTVAANVLSNV